MYIVDQLETVVNITVKISKTEIFLMIFSTINRTVVLS